MPEKVPGTRGSVVLFVPSPSNRRRWLGRDLLLERYAEHAVSSDFSQETVAFFNAHVVASAVEDLPGCE